MNCTKFNYFSNCTNFELNCTSFESNCTNFELNYTNFESISDVNICNRKNKEKYWMSISVKKINLGMGSLSMS